MFLFHVAAFLQVLSPQFGELPQHGALLLIQVGGGGDLDTYPQVTAAVLMQAGCTQPG